MEFRAHEDTLGGVGGLGVPAALPQNLVKPVQDVDPVVELTLGGREGGREKE